MTPFSIDTDQLEARIDELARFDRMLGDQLDRLDETMGQLRGNWSGSASDAQQRAHQEWSRGFDEMRRAVVGMREVARVAHANYTSAARTNVRMWSQVG